MNHAASAHEHAAGARPAAEATEADAAEHVRELFTSIAPTYDRLNHLLSFGLDRRWWRRTARTFRDTLARPDARVLDLCCGTGDLTAALLALRPAHAPGAPSSPTVLSSANAGSASPEILSTIEPILGLDFSPKMLALARAKYPSVNIRWVEGDAMHLPYSDNTFDLITSAFGFRNLTDYAAGLREIHRVLKPGGQIGILEANQPSGLAAALYNPYFKFVLPLIGGLLSGDRAAYQYLPASVQRFPRPPRMLHLMEDAGFAHCAWEGYLLRAAGLYRGIKR